MPYLFVPSCSETWNHHFTGYSSRDWKLHLPSTEDYEVKVIQVLLVCSTQLPTDFKTLAHAQHGEKQCQLFSCSTHVKRLSLSSLHGYRSCFCLMLYGSYLTSPLLFSGFASASLSGFVCLIIIKRAFCNCFMTPIRCPWAILVHYIWNYLGKIKWISQIILGLRIHGIVESEIVTTWHMGLQKGWYLPYLWGL